MTTAIGTNWIPPSSERTALRKLPSVTPSVVRARTDAPVLIVTIVFVSLACHLRWSLATTTKWHCDEIPLLVRFTGLCGTVTNEAEAARFAPTFHSFRMGVLRSFHVPDYTFSAHTTTNFWVNLGVHVFGMGLGGGRAGSLFWSGIAILAVVAAVWLVGGGVPGACVAALIVAFSPFGTAYAAQARGYSESMALAPLFLIVLELLRRDPRSLVRAVCVLICALQLALTVYTTWIFWVFPVLAVAVCVLPRNANFADERAYLRLAVVLIAVAVCLFMIAFTAERWKTLTFAAKNGERFENVRTWLVFLQRFGRQLVSGPEAMVPLVLVGVVALVKSRMRWWVLPMGAGFVMPALFGWMNGSPGYSRNLTYLLGPVAILAGLGADGGLKLLQRFVPWRAFTVFVAGILSLSATWAYAGLQARSEAILLPDWGQVVERYNQEPESIGPRWYCPCMANHWQTEWYEPKRPAEDFWDVPIGTRIEVVMGAQRGEDDVPRVYSYDPALGFIAEKPLPAFLAAVSPSAVPSGVEIRRWIGSRIPEPEASALSPAGPAFLFLRYPRVPPTVQWDRFLADDGVRRHGVVVFKEKPLSNGVLQSMLVPAGSLDAVVDALQRCFGVERQDVRLFRLDPFHE